ncbi:MAG: hypothetical protein AB1331_03155, partial [Bacillota bacterium]
TGKIRLIYSTIPATDRGTFSQSHFGTKGVTFSQSVDSFTSNSLVKPLILQHWHQIIIADRLHPAGEPFLHLGIPQMGTHE